MQDSLGSMPDAPSNISLREYLDILRRRRAIIIQTAAIVLVIGVLLNIYSNYVYKASARLLLAPTSFAINTINTSDPLSDFFQTGQQYSTLTQVQMLQSGEVRQKAQEAMGGKPLPLITVIPVEGTQIIDVFAEGEDQDAVGQAPNELLKSYIAKQKSDSTDRLDKAFNLAQDKSKEFKNLLDDIDRRIRNFKDLHSITELDRNKESELLSVSAIAQQLFQARSDLRSKQTQIEATRAKMKEVGATSNAALSELGDPQLSGLEAKLVDLNIQRTVALKDFPLGSLPLARIDLQIAEYKKRQADLQNNFIQRNQVRNPLYEQLSNNLVTMSIDSVTAARRVVDMEDQYKTAQGRLAQFPAWEKDWSALQRERDSTLALQTAFANSQTVLSLRKSVEKQGAQIMQFSSRPSIPIRPERVRNILMAGLLGIFLGLCLALLQELFDDRINSPEEAERTLHVPNLGMIPLIEESGLRLIRDTTSFSPMMEQYRTLRTNINFAAVGRPVRSLVVTSAVPAEGKSTTVANLAMAMALDNKRVIIVDADLRRPSLHKLFKMDSSPGLTDLLIGTHQIDQVLRSTPVNNVSVIPAGSPPPNPAELLGSAAMGQLLAELETHADIVLFDSPPVIPVTDSVVLASRTNGVLLVVGFGETKKASARKALDMLGRANANVLGTVLNRLEGPGGGYYGYYGKYYVPVSDRAKSEAGVAANAPESRAALPEGDANEKKEG